MRNVLLGAAALGALGILAFAGPADAAASRQAPGIHQEQGVDLSAVHRRRHLRYGSRWAAPRYRYVRPYRHRYYAGPYYRPYPYYYRPYYRPYAYAPFPFFAFRLGW